jgi:hypothetical protein
MSRRNGKRSKRNSAPERTIDEPYIDHDGNLQRENVQNLLDELENINPVEPNVVQASEQQNKQSNKAECWEYAEKLDSSKWKCKLCKNIYAGGATRAT